MWEKFEPVFIRLRDQIQDSELFIEFQSRFSELEPKTQQIATLSIAGVVTLIVLYIPVSLAMSVSNKKSAIHSAQETIYFLKKSKKEISSLNDQVRQTNQAKRKSVDPNASLQEIAAKSASKASVSEASVEIKEDEGAAASITMSLNKISIRQLMGAIHSIEASGALVAITGLDVDLKNDRKGYMWAKVTLQKTSSQARNSEQNENAKDKAK